MSIKEEKELSFNTIEVILKTTEVCNINCSYCYYFTEEYQKYKKLPKNINKKIINQTADFLLDTARKVSANYIQINFHGGEPLIQKKEDFNYMCEAFREKLEKKVKINFSLQTNGILIDDSWLELFKKHSVNVGVSLDGNQLQNDKYRIDFKGKGTYDRVIQGLNKLKKSAEKKYIPAPGIIAVINPAFRAKEIYFHFVKELGISNLDFLLPDYTHDGFIKDSTYSDFKVKDYGNFLCEILEEWQKDYKSVYIRFIASSINFFNGLSSSVSGFGSSNNDVLLMTIFSDGTISIDDTLGTVYPQLAKTGLNVSFSKIHEVINHNLFNIFYKELNTLPDNCLSCCWKKICSGGNLIHRYDNKNYFNNSSLMCEGLKEFYCNLVKFLIKKNFPINQIITRLSLNYNKEY